MYAFLIYYVFNNSYSCCFSGREDEDDVAAYPIVKESAAKLIETGLNTMQKTLLLKKEIEVDRVSDELAAKRAEFRQRMDRCAQQQVEIQKKQQRVSYIRMCTFSL